MLAKITPLILAVLVTGLRIAGAQAEKAEDLAKALDETDRTVWSKELEAQRHEAVMIAFWDELRRTPITNRHRVLAGVDFENLTLGTRGDQRDLEMGIRETKSKPGKALDADGWKAWLASMRAVGHRIVQSEWHHSGFVPGKDGAPNRSTVTYELHVGNALDPAASAILKGTLKITWRTKPDLIGRPVLQDMDASQFTLLEREGTPPFRRSLRIAPSPSRPGGSVVLGAIVVRDLNGDGLPEIILGGVNQLFWNKGGLKFQEKPLFVDPERAILAAVVEDFTGDGRLDYLGVDHEGKAWLVAGEKDGTFTGGGRQAWAEVAKLPSAITCGDVDADGDLDVWFAQYKIPYDGGQMPTPYYDANDGYPSHLFLNDGTGKFTDATEAASLAAKRHRRTYSASFVDLDDDRDLDLIVVSDFAGLDAYLNDGKGRFREATSELFDERLGFGMAHAFGDFDRDVARISAWSA